MGAVIGFGLVATGADSVHWSQCLDIGLSWIVTPIIADFIEWVADFEFEGYKTTNLEMETAVIYGLCEALGHKACSVSAVMANRRSQSVGTYGVVVEDMVLRLFERLISSL